MEDINFTITEFDIKEYLKKCGSSEEIKYKEAMFIKYIKETEELTEEKLRMILAKYNIGNSFYPNAFTYIKDNTLVKRNLPTFNNYLSQLKNLDVSGICHVAISVLGSSDIKKKSFYIRLVKNNIKKAVKDFNIDVSSSDLDFILEDSILNYQLLGEARLRKETQHNYYLDILMRQHRALKELDEYRLIYGTMKVKKLEKIIREG